MPTVNKYKIREGQSLFDVSLQEAGTIEAVFEINETNKTKITAVDVVPESGTIIKIPGIENKLVVDYYRSIDHKVVSAASKLCILIDSESFILKDSTGAILTVKCF